jgi:glycerol kinase
MTYLIGIDQGTSGSRALIMDDHGRVHGYGYRSLPRSHPHPGWTEQDPHILARGVSEAITEALGQAGLRARDITACGIASQRNTDFVWSAQTGEPIAPAITWQDLRTVPMVEALAQEWPHFADLRRRLGYFPGPYSSALHLAWRMKHDTAVQQAAAEGDLRIGFSALWQLINLGQANGHIMDYGLVQAMGLYDFRADSYWQEWLDYLGIPRYALPEPVPNLHDFGYLTLWDMAGGHADVPVLATIGNEQAALFGHQCWQAGSAECTHGTASFVNVFLDEYAPEAANLNIYHAWHLGQKPTYCLEADTAVTGAAIRWMQEQMRFFEHPPELGALAGSVPDSGGVVFVPAFTGLNVPHHDPTARGTILGLTLGSQPAHIARAFLEAVAYQVRAILETIEAQTAVTIPQLSVGGGLAGSELACQIQADILGLPIVRPAFTEMSARAAALLAGMGAGIWSDTAVLPPLSGTATTFTPTWSASQREAGYDRWQEAVRRVKGWEK